MIIEDQLEQLSLDWFRKTGWEYANGVDISPGGDGPEREYDRVDNDLPKQTPEQANSRKELLWLGHCSRIAEQHSLQMTADHWGLATGKIGGNAGVNICANSQGSTAVSA